MPAMLRPLRGLISVLVFALGAWLAASPGAAASPASSQSPTPAALSIATPPPLQAPTSSSSVKPISVTSPTAKADDGTYVKSETWLDPRMADLVIGSTAVGAVVPVRIIVPARWSTDPDGKTWPVLYLLHGGNDNYTSWTRETDIESFIFDKDVIVVMPDNSPAGLPTRWLNDGKNKPDYETFDAVELMQLLERDYHANSTRAVAGVSAGGYGAIILAAHYPRTFAAAASYSGFLDTTAPGIPVLMRATQFATGINPDEVWGDPSSSTGMQLWNEDNPYAQATNLRWTSLFLSCGDGTGPTHTAVEVLAQLGEGVLRSQNIAFGNRLNMLGIAVQTDFYTGGVHNWVSWRGTFAASWPILAASLGLPT